MKKSKAKFLFTLICVLLVGLITITFIRFTTGITDFNGILGAINSDYDIGGGYSYEITLADDNDEDIADKDVVKALSERLDYLGFKAYSLQTIKNTDPNASASELVSSFVITVPAEKDAYGKDDVANLTSSIAAVIRDGEVEIFHGTKDDITNKLDIDGEIFEKVSYIGQYGEMYGVSAKLTENAWTEITTAESQATDTFYLKISLGDMVLTNGAFSSSQFTDRTIYFESDTMLGAKQQALQVGMGGLSFKFNETEQTLNAVKVDAIFGADTQTIIAVLFGVVALLIIIALFVKFKGLGVVSMITMLGFVYTLVAMLVAVPGIVLSIPGVIGMFATLFAAGAILFSTLNAVSEEFAKGKTVRSAIKSAFNKTFKTALGITVIFAIVGIALLLTSGTTTCLGAILGIGAVVSFLANTLLARLIANCIVSMSAKPEVVFNLKRTEE